MDLYNLNAYEVTHVVSNNKIAGGYSVYVHESIEFKIVKSFCYSFEDEFECYTIRFVENNKAMWLDNRIMDLYNLDGYEVTHVVGNNNIGGGC